MGISNVVSQRAIDDPARMGGEMVRTSATGEVAAKRKGAEIDASKGQKLHGKLMNWMLQERDKQGPNRYEMAIDEDFYDGLQWTEEEAQELINRSQAPLVFNQVKPTINWLLGTERRTRVDGKVLPREEGDEKGAEVKTKLLKYLSDVNRTPFNLSQTWKSCIVAGMGWIEDCIQVDPSEEMLTSRHVDWKNVYHDSNAKEMDLSDARYIFRWSFVDLDVAIALVPGKRRILEAAAIDDNQLGIDEDDVWYLGSRVNSSMANSGDYAATTRRGMSGGLVNQGRERVKLIECWYRVPVSCKVCRSSDIEGQPYHGEEWDPKNADMKDAYDSGYISVANHVRMEVRCALMTESVLLYDGKSPYKHNRLPFTAMWCYRRHRDLLPYGVIRDIRDAQVDYNKRASKALYILSTVRVIMDEDAVDDIEHLRSEIARPDSITKRRGAELKLEQDKALAEEHIKLMMFDGQMIRDVGGVTDQNLGKDDKGLSGQAIGKLQDQGSIVTAPLFDNYRLAYQLSNETKLSLMEQYYSTAKVVRIVGENKPVEWLKINQYDQASGEYLNDITKSKADYIVSEQDFKASIRQAMFESMMELIAKLPPQVGLSLLDMVIDFADVPNKDELVARVRKINGQADPSRKPTPEEEKAQQERDMKQQQVEQVQFETMQAGLAKLQSEASKNAKQVEEISARITKTVNEAVQVAVTAAYEALQAGQIVATVPNVTPVADSIMAGAGWQDSGGQDPNLPQPTGALPELTPRSDHGDYVGAPAGGQEAPPPELQQADGAAAGIKTLANDGVQ